MLCEKCKQNKASMHMHHIINGEKIELYLCQECAAKSDMPLSFDSFLQGFLNSYVNHALKNETTHIKCPTCGLNYREFKSLGRLGCSNCYQAFKKELDILLKNIQGSNVHQGKFPRKSGATMLTKRQLENLKRELNKAIENEEYEEAAKIRDKIKSISYTDR